MRSTTVALYAGLLLMVLPLLAGCGAGNSNISVSVSSLAAPAADAARRYTLVPGNQGIRPEDLQFREYSEYLDRALISQGFERASSSADANVVVVVSYGISEPQTRTYTYAVPQWGQTGIASSNTYGTLSSYGNTATYSGTTYYQPSYGVTGYTTGVGQVTTFTRYMSLAAVDASTWRASSQATELWRLDAVSTGTTGDMRRMLPVLVAASLPYLGRATPGHAVQVEISRSDPNYQVVLGVDRKEPTAGKAAR